jgi:beta-glucosidase
VDTPPKQLLGWARVTLRPREERWVTVPVRLGTSEHLLGYWRTADDPPRNGQWVTARGDVPIYVGSASDDIRLEGSMFVR